MKFEHGGNIFSFAKALNLPETEIIDYSVNLNPLGFPKYIPKLIEKNISKLYHYPEIYSQSLKDKISENLECKSSQIVIGNGSTQLIYTLPLILKIKKPIIVNPTFSEYKNSLFRYNIKPFNYKLNENHNFIINPELLLNYLNKKDFDTLYICNPANPNGFTLSDDEIEDIANFCRKKEIIFILDEAFIDFTNKSGLTNKNLKNTIVIKSLTKIFGIAGLRLGFLKLWSSQLGQKIEKYIEPWSVNIFSIILGKNLICDNDFINKTKNFVEKEREFVVKELEQIKNLKIFPSETNFLLIKILLPELTVLDLEKYLIKRNIIIRNCSNFIGLNNKFFRIGIKKREENILLIKFLKDFFRKEN